MSNIAFEKDGSREAKAPKTSGLPVGRLVELNAAAADAQATCERWHSELQSVQEQHRALTHEVRQMSRLHEQKTSEVNRLLSLEASQNEQLVKLNGHRELLQSRLQEINARYLQDQGRLQQTQQQLSEWESHKQSVEAQVAAASRQLAGLKAESALLEERSSELSDLLQKAIDEVTRQQERIVEARGLVLRHETRHQELTINIARMEVSAQQTEANLKLKQERLNYLEEAGSRATGHVVDLTSRYQALEQNFTLLTAQCRESEASLNITRSAIADERARLQEARQAVQETHQNHADLQNAVRELAGQRVAAATALGELKSEAVQHEQTLIMLRQQRTKCQAEMDELRACQQTLAQAVLARRGELARMEEKLGITLNECTEATTQLADLGRAVAQLEQHETTSVQQIQQLTQEIADLGVKRQQVKDQIADTETSLAALGQRHHALGEEIVVLVNTRQSTADALQSCRAELATTEERLKNTQDDCLAAEKRLSSLNQTLQERQEQEAILGDHIHVLEQQSHQLEAQTQEQSGKLEAMRQERIGTEIALQRLSQQHEEAGIRLESRHAEIDTTSVRLQQVMHDCQQAEERRMALSHEVENLLMRQQNQEMILREVEAQIARREQEREASTAGARQAQQEHETIVASVVAARRELSEQQAGITATTAKLSELQSAVQATEQNLTTTSATLAGQEQKLVETRSALDAASQELQLAHDLKVTLEALTSRQANVAAAEQHLGILGRQVEEASQRRTQLDAALKDITQQLATATASCDAVNQQETETRQRLDQMTAQEKELRQEIATLTASAQQERVMYDEFRSLSKDARELHDQESSALNGQIKDLRQQLSGWETQITTLLDWKERMDLCLNRLQQAEADSPESRNAKDEILMALGALRQIMERLQTSKMESSRQTSVEGSASARTVNSSTSTSSTETKTGSTLLSEVRPNSRLSRLREELQREESRLNFLRQNSRALELRARIRPSLPSLKEGQNGGNQEGSSQWEERIKSAAIDETNLLEKIATLKGQIAELRGEVQSPSALSMDTSG